MKVILLGLPGSGKGTQGNIISERQGIPHISTGDLFRTAYQENTETGVLAKGYMDRGELVPDEVTNEIAINRLELSDCSEGFLLDGYPRNNEQAVILGNYLNDKSMDIDHVIYIEVNESLLIKRLTGRRVCKECGATYHLIFNPSTEVGICDVCFGELVQRSDDTEEAVIERLRINNELTTGLINFYKAAGKLRVVNGTQDINEVTRDIVRTFEEVGNSR